MSPLTLLPMSLAIGIQKVLAGTTVALGAVSGVAATTLPEDGPVLLLSLGSIISIGLGFYWYGRLTERVKAEQEAREKLEVRVHAIENLPKAEPRVIERMADSVERLALAVNTINTRLGIQSDHTHNAFHHTPGA